MSSWHLVAVGGAQPGDPSGDGADRLLDPGRLLGPCAPRGLAGRVHHRGWSGCDRRVGEDRKHPCRRSPSTCPASGPNGDVVELADRGTYRVSFGTRRTWTSSRPLRRRWTSCLEVTAVRSWFPSSPAGTLALTGLRSAHGADELEGRSTRGSRRRDVPARAGRGGRWLRLRHVARRGARVG